MVINVDGRQDTWTAGRKGGSMGMWMWMDGRTHRRLDGWIVGWMNGCIWVDGWTDGWMNKLVGKWLHEYMVSTNDLHSSLKYSFPKGRFIQDISIAFL